MINQDVYLDFEVEARKLKQTVEYGIENKLNELPLSLRLNLMDKCILSGSSISSAYHGEVPKDLDLWCRDANDIQPLKQLVIESYLPHVKSYSKNYGSDEMPLVKQSDGSEKKYLITSNAITFHNDVQLITLAQYQTARMGFDFMHCLPYFDLLTRKLHISRHQWEAIKTKKLVQNGINDPKAYRIEKFKKRGWSF